VNAWPTVPKMKLTKTRIPWDCYDVEEGVTFPIPHPASFLGEVHIRHILNLGAREESVSGRGARLV
jgi:hypothetical protein